MKSPLKWNEEEKAVPRIGLSDCTSAPMRLLMIALARQQHASLDEWLEDHLRQSLLDVLDRLSNTSPFGTIPSPPPQSDLGFPEQHSNFRRPDSPPSDEDFWPRVQAWSEEIAAALESLRLATPAPRKDAHTLWTGKLPKFTHLTAYDGKREWLEKLDQMGPHRAFFRVRPAHLRKVENLLADAPNLGPATRFLLGQLQVASRSRTGLSNLPRILLVGPPAAGKTWWAEQVAAALGLRTCHLSMPCVTASFELSGNTSQWSGAKPGQILRAFLESDSASPIIILDEIDKVMTHNSNPPGNTLLNLIERSSAIRWRDEFYDREFDVSTAIIIATANDPARIDKPLLSRFHRIDVPVPQRDQLPAMVRSVWRQYRTLRADLSLQRDLDEGVVQKIVARTNDARSVMRLLDEAIGRAVMRGRQIRITEHDLCGPKPTSIRAVREPEGPHP